MNNFSSKQNHLIRSIIAKNKFKVMKNKQHENKKEMTLIYK